MSQYLLVIIWLGILYIISQNVNVYTNENIFGENEIRVSVAFAVFSVLPLIYWTATRNIWFGDTNAYISNFKSLPDSFENIWEYVINVKKDKGYTVFGFIIKQIIGNRPILYLGIIATIQSVVLSMVYRKYSTNYVMAMFIFVAITDYLSWMHNGIRQFMAVSLIMAATDLMLKKKYLPLIAIILLASTMHGSALLMIPIIFIVQGEPWNKKTMLMILIFLLAIVYVENFTTLLDGMLEETQYTNVVSDWQKGQDDGTNPIRVFIYAIPTLLSIVGLPHIKTANNPIINLACNMGIVSTMLYCLSMVTSGIFIGRLPIYCSLYATGILLPWELENIFTKKSAKIIKLLTVAGFLGFYFYQTYFIWGLI